MTKAQRKKKLRIQKAMGVGLILISIGILILTNHAPATEMRDGTAVLMTAPFGIWFLFSKKVVIR